MNNGGKPLTNGPLKVKVISPEAKARTAEMKSIDRPKTGMQDAKMMKKLRVRRIMIKTICNSLALFVLGVMLSMKGPSFIDLQIITGTDVEGGSIFFTAFAFGYMIGSLIAGALYSRIQTSMLMVINLVLAGVTNALTPWCENFMTMVAINIANACFTATFETTANTEEVRHWEGNCDSAMQFLSFAYSLGGIIGPLLTEPFLAPKANTSIAPSPAPHASHASNSSNDLLPSRADHTRSTEDGNRSVSNTVSYLSLVSPHERDTHQARFAVGLSSSALSLNSSGMNHDSSRGLITTLGAGVPSSAGSATRIHIPYLIAGVMSILVAVPFFLIYLKSRRRASALKKADAKHQELKAVAVTGGGVHTQRRPQLPLKVYIMLLGLLSSFYFFYTTVDDPFSMYLSMFVVSHLSWTKEDGALVSSIYWSCSTVTKLAMVILVRHVNTSLVLLFSTLGMFLSTLLLVFCSSLHVHYLVWVSSALLAISQSAVFGGGFAWADSHLLRVDGKVTSCTIFFAALGCVLDPILLGTTMKEISPMAFPVVMCAQSLITFLLFLSMLLLASPYVLRRFGPPRPSITLRETEGKVVAENEREKGEEEEEEEREDSECQYLGSVVKDNINGVLDEDRKLIGVEDNTEVEKNKQGSTYYEGSTLCAFNNIDR